MADANYEVLIKLTDQLTAQINAVERAVTDSAKTMASEMTRVSQVEKSVTVNAKTMASEMTANMNAVEKAVTGNTRNIAAEISRVSEEVGGAVTTNAKHVTTEMTRVGTVMKAVFVGQIANTVLRQVKRAFREFTGDILDAVKAQDALAGDGGQFKKLESAYGDLMKEVAKSVVSSDAFKDATEGLITFLKSPDTIAIVKGFANAIVAIAKAAADAANAVTIMSNALSDARKEREEFETAAAMAENLKRIRAARRDEIPIALQGMQVDPATGAVLPGQRIIDVAAPLDRGMITGAGMATRAVFGAPSPAPAPLELIERGNQALGGKLFETFNEFAVAGIDKLRESSQSLVNVIGDMNEALRRQQEVMERGRQAFIDYGAASVNAMFDSADAMAAGEITAKQAFKNIALAAIQSLAARARTEALAKLAEGFGYLAVGKGPAAALAFKSAALWGLVGGAASVAAGSLRREGGQSAGRESQSDTFIRRRNEAGADRVIGTATPIDPGSQTVTINVQGSVVTQTQLADIVADVLSKRGRDGRRLTLNVRT